MTTVFAEYSTAAFSADGSLIGLARGSGSMTIDLALPIAERSRQLQQGFLSSRGIEVRGMNGELVAAWDSDQGQVNALLFLSDGRLVSAGYDGTVKIWAYGLEEPVAVLAHANPVWGVHSVDGCGVLVTSDGEVRLWDIGELMNGGVGQSVGKGTAPRLSADCNHIVAARGSEIVVFDISSGREVVYAVMGEVPVAQVDFLSDERVLALGEDGYVRIFPTSFQMWGEEARSLLRAYDRVGP